MISDLVKKGATYRCILHRIRLGKEIDSNHINSLSCLDLDEKIYLNAEIAYRVKQNVSFLDYFKQLTEATLLGSSDAALELLCCRAKEPNWQSVFPSITENEFIDQYVVNSAINKFMSGRLDYYIECYLEQTGLSRFFLPADNEIIEAQLL